MGKIWLLKAFTHVGLMPMKHWVCEKMLQRPVQSPSVILSNEFLIIEVES